MTSKLNNEDLEQIGQYLAEKYPILKSGTNQFRYSEIDLDIRERIVRVEEELKNQRELIHEVLKMMDKRFEEARADSNARFEQVDKRFEQVDKRFEEINSNMNSRFNMMMWFMGLGFTIVTAFIAGVIVILK